MNSGWSEMITDSLGYTIKVKKVVHIFRMGWIGDSEGRTWAKELYAESIFPTRELAELHRAHHPDAFQDPWGGWRTKYPNGQIGIFTEEREVSTEELSDLVTGPFAEAYCKGKATTGE